MSSSLRTRRSVILLKPKQETQEMWTCTSQPGWSMRQVLIPDDGHRMTAYEFTRTAVGPDRRLTSPVGLFDAEVFTVAVKSTYSKQFPCLTSTEPTLDIVEGKIPNAIPIRSPIFTGAPQLHRETIERSARECYRRAKAISFHDGPHSMHKAENIVDVAAMASGFHDAWTLAMVADIAKESASVPTKGGSSVERCVLYASVGEEQRNSALEHLAFLKDHGIGRPAGRCLNVDLYDRGGDLVFIANHERGALLATAIVETPSGAGVTAYGFVARERDLQAMSLIATTVPLTGQSIERVAEAIGNAPADVAKKGLIATGLEAVSKQLSHDEGVKLKAQVGFKAQTTDAASNGRRSEVQKIYAA